MTLIIRIQKKIDRILYALIYLMFQVISYPWNLDCSVYWPVSKATFNKYYVGRYYTVCTDKFL